MSEIPDTWINTNLKTVANLVTGNTPSTKSPEYYGGSVPFVKPGDLDSADPITVTEQQLTELGAQQSRLVRAGSTLVSCIGNLGKVGFAGVPLATNQQINSAEFHREIVDDRYGYYLCKTLKSWMERESSATTIAILNKGKFGEAPFPLAPLPEQKRIANKLDTVLTRVDAVNTRLARVAPLLKRFRQSVLSAAVNGGLITEASLSSPKNWRSVTLGDLIEDGPKNGLYKPSSAYGAGVRILRIDSFYDGKVSDWASLRLLSIDSSELKQFGLMNGDLVINRVNSIEYLGKCALVEGLQGECVFESNMMRFRLSPRLANPRFIRTWLCSEAARTQIVAKAKHAVNQASINQSDVCGLKLQLPPLSEQTEIVRRVETLFAFADRLEARLAQAQTAATRLTPALLAKAFRGELVPQDPNDEPAAELLRRLQAERATAPKASAGRGRKAAVRSEG